MGEIVEDNTLYNCTGILLLKLDPSRNMNALWTLNRSQVLELLDFAVEEIDRMKNPVKRTAIRDFISECLFPTSRPYDLVWWQKLVWTIIFAAMLLVSTGGNIIVMWIVLAHRRMRTVTNYFLVNLSVSDLLMSLLNCVFNYIFMINSDWPFGALYCTVNNFVANVTVASSVFTLVAISMDRYMAIVRPLQHRMSRRRARMALVIIWLASGILAVPCLLYSTTMTRRYANAQTRIVCYMQWPDGRYPTSMTDYMYNLVFLGVTYLVPVTAMAICYTLMGRELWGSRTIGELTQRQAESIKSKRKVVRMLIMVFSIFAFCWLPYHGYFIYAYHNNSITASNYVQHMYLAFYWLAMSNAMVNPLIYYWMNNRFRVYFQSIICQCCYLRRKDTINLELRTTKQNNSQSDLARSRSDKYRGQIRGASIHWRRRTQETQVLNIMAPLPCSNGIITGIDSS